MAIARRMKFEYYRRLTLRGRRWFFRIRARNGEIVGQGETNGYVNREDCLNGARVIMRDAHEADIVLVEM